MQHCSTLTHGMETRLTGQRSGHNEWGKLYGFGNSGSLALSHMAATACTTQSRALFLTGTGAALPWSPG